MGSHMPSSEAFPPFLEGGCCLLCKELIITEDSAHMQCMKTFERSLGVLAGVSVFVIRDTAPTLVLIQPCVVDWAQTQSIS